MQFPSDFLWGAATSSYQIEGAVNEDGRGDTIWDVFCRTPGKVANGDTGDVACDHYHRYKDDVALMASLGLKGYRFSVAWSRIFPEGRGRIEPRGLDFYDRLVDELLAHNITPFLTLYHWDLPQALQEIGGWENRDTLSAFAAYADTVSRKLGDRVKHFATHNEPFVIAFVGNLWGIHAPGKQDLAAALLVSHHLMVSHGMAIDALRANVPDGKHGIVLNFTPSYPATLSHADREAARLVDGFNNRWFIDAILRGHYPPDMAQHFGAAMFDIQDGDQALMTRPIDFLGVNYYTRNLVRAGNGMFKEEYLKTDNEYTDMDWEVYPQALFDLLMRFKAEYHTPELYITENGSAWPDVVAADGKVYDDGRERYLRGHLAACWRAIQEGVPLKGYFQWSLLDNFEWAEGYNKRFGMTYVDYATQQRILKQSGHFYQRVVAANALPS
ncbi:MAG: GH1 family beta-glucosidase [Anaerolineae bacterium]